MGVKDEKDDKANAQEAQNKFADISSVCKAKGHSFVLNEVQPEP